MTKKDLRDEEWTTDGDLRPDFITKDQVHDKKQQLGLKAAHFTSSKDWQTMNVHKAVQSALQLALDSKYGVAKDSDDDY